MGEGAVYRELTVARLRVPERADHLEVLFLESARIYRLARDREDFDVLVDRLRASEAEGRPVSVAIASLHDDLVEDVQAL